MHFGAEQVCLLILVGLQAMKIAGQHAQQKYFYYIIINRKGFKRPTCTVVVQIKLRI